MGNERHSRRETDSSHRQDRSRSRSPYRNSHAHRHKRRRTETPPAKPAGPLPYGARPLGKHDFDAHKELFALYLDLQKELRIEDISEKEARGRWRSFRGKWNRGELAEGYYDPKTKQRADDAAVDTAFARREAKRSPDSKKTLDNPDLNAAEEDEGSSEDDFGPALPSQRYGGNKSGPAIPNIQDLELAAELRAEDSALARANQIYHRKADRKLQKERLEELVPRADPGSHERKLEKRREVAVMNAGFREAREGGDVEVGDGDLMGDDGIDGYKKRKREMERKKTERELRKEEQLRARQAERDEKMKAAREKEEKTVEYLKALAKERFG